MPNPTSPDVFVQPQATETTPLHPSHATDEREETCYTTAYAAAPFIYAYKEIVEPCAGSSLSGNFIVDETEARYSSGLRQELREARDASEYTRATALTCCWAVVGPFALVASGFGLFAGATRDTANACSNKCATESVQTNSVTPGK